MATLSHASTSRIIEINSDFNSPNTQPNWSDTNNRQWRIQLVGPTNARLWLRQRSSVMLSKRLPDLAGFLSELPIEQFLLSRTRCWFASVARSNWPMDGQLWARVLTAPTAPCRPIAVLQTLFETISTETALLRFPITVSWGLQTTSPSGVYSRLSDSPRHALNIFLCDSVDVYSNRTIRTASKCHGRLWQLTNPTTWPKPENKRVGFRYAVRDAAACTIVVNVKRSWEALSGDSVWAQHLVTETTSSLGAQGFAVAVGETSSTVGHHVPMSASIFFSGSAITSGPMESGRF